MPGQEEPVAMRTEVVVDFGLLGPVARVARRQRLHGLDGVAISLEIGIVERERMDVRSCHDLTGWWDFCFALARRRERLCSRHGQRKSSRALRQHRSSIELHGGLPYCG